MSETAPPSPPSGGSPPPQGSAATVDEFANVPGPRRSRHPVLAAGAVALAAFLAWQMRSDLGYALSSTTVRDLGDARALVAATQPLPYNRLVRLRGLPDRESAVVLDTQGSWKFAQFFRLLGTDSRVFVRRASDPLPAALAERDVFTGRLIRFEDLSFAESIRGHFSAHVAATHVFRADALVTALRAGGRAATVVDLAGDQVSLSAGDALALDVERPGEVRIDLSRERFPELPAARAAVEGQGGTIVETRSTGDRHVVVAAFPPARRDPALSALSDLDRKVRIRAARSTLQTRLGDVTVGDQRLTVKTKDGQSHTVPLAQIPAVRTLSSVRIPDDAILLLEGDEPRQHMKAVLVVGLLVAFAAINLLALRRTS